MFVCRCQPATKQCSSTGLLVSILWAVLTRDAAGSVASSVDGWPDVQGVCKDLQGTPQQLLAHLESMLKINPYQMIRLTLLKSDMPLEARHACRCGTASSIDSNLAVPALGIPPSGHAHTSAAASDDTDHAQPCKGSFSACITSSCRQVAREVADPAHHRGSEGPMGIDLMPLKAGGHDCVPPLPSHVCFSEADGNRLPSSTCLPMQGESSVSILSDVGSLFEDCTGDAYLSQLLGVF